MNEAPLKRVLFVCIGNCCRSQMAEGFARAYGADVMVAASAGVAPTHEVAADTLRAMHEKHIDLRDHYPKSVRHLSRVAFDIVVNMSGLDVPVENAGAVLEWDVEDPYGLPLARYREVRDRIERLVMELVIRLRQERQAPL